MGQTVSCDKCGDAVFEGPERDYYGAAYLFECASCGNTISINEHVEA